MSSEALPSSSDPGPGITSVPGVVEISRFDPPGADRGSPPALLIEIPHGATRRTHYDALRARLVGALPDELEAFFFVNTDIGAPECAQHIGEALAGAGLSVLVARCEIPRTFIDCNRVVQARTDGAVVDGLTPALAAYITDPADRALLEDLHRRYQAIVDGCYAWVCGAGGLALQLHSYAPRSVQIDRIDGSIVGALRRAYLPEVYATWAERPEVDVISATADGALWSARALIDALQRRYAEIGVAVTENATYHMHPATTGYAHARRHPEQVLCVELNRGLLADPFTPFEESVIGAQKVARMAPPIAAALRDYLSQRSGAQRDA